MAPALLLINPAMTAQGQRVPNAGGMATMEPLSLAYVAAETPPNWDVRIVDEVMEDIPQDETPDLVGLTALTITAPRAYELASHYRRRGVPVVMGGVHATLLPDEAARYVDVVFQGEAEASWPALQRRPAVAAGLVPAPQGPLSASLLLAIAVGVAGLSLSL